MELQDYFAVYPRAALGFSGGVDSAYLLWAARKAGADVRPYYIKTAFQPAFELEDARRIAAQVGVELSVVEVDIHSCQQVVSNPPDRCCHCKKVMFSALQEQAARDGYTLLLDGTNASDDIADRPGMKALQELGVRSPLRECGLDKLTIRKRSKEAGLFTWNKPAYACLATRVPAGEFLTEELLCRIEQAEDALYKLGFSDLRVRVFHGAARIQLPQKQIGKAAECWQQIDAALRPCFETVLLDLKGR